ncbi:hypothetical protein M1M85_00535 [Nitrospinaceae bacterium]|nr:hypothetical protein [Nitrospinaceae bacterium]
MSLQTQKHKRIYLPREICASVYLQKKGEIMPKQMVLKGKVLYAHCKFIGVHLRDCLGTNIPDVAEQKLFDLKTLIKKREYHAWKKSFEEVADDWLATRDINKPHHMEQEVNVRVHLKPYFGKSKVRDIIKVDEKIGREKVSDSKCNW